VPGALAGLFGASTSARVKLTASYGSLLANNFNRLWCEALNTRAERGWTHFAMHHADVSAEPRWLDTLLAEMDRVAADVLSVVIPLKDERGLTSTAVRTPGRDDFRRLTLREVMALPPTFAAADVALDKVLLVNTGLWLCRFTAPWVEGVCFEVRDRIYQDEAGRFRAAVLPEDWNFALWCADHGLKVFATRAVKVTHRGGQDYGNDTAWGTWATDQGE
jgi:hypothetical protein